MNVLKIAAIISVFAMVLFAGCSKQEQQTQKQDNTKTETSAGETSSVTVDTNTYYASEKFDFWQDYPGSSPKGTPMTKVTDPKEINKIHEAMGAGSNAVVYTCEMHPQVRQNYTGKCPVCKMDLIKIDKPEQKNMDMKDHKNMDMKDKNMDKKDMKDMNHKSENK